MLRCIVKGCSNRTSMKNRKQEESEKAMKITFHLFPKCPIKRELWLKSLGLHNSVLPKCAAVCSVHFRHEHLDRTSLVCIRLKENALPYMKLSESRVEENLNACEEFSTEEPSTSTSSAVMETGDSVGFTEPMNITGGKRMHLGNTGSHEVSEKVLKIESEYKNEHVGALLETSNISTESKVSLVDKHTCISQRRLFHLQRKQILREHISKMKKRHQVELKALEIKIRRRDRNITDLQTILQTLKKKNLLQEEHVHSLSGISNFNNELFERLKRIYRLITLKSRGGLAYPSSDLVTICRRAEKVVRFYLVQDKLPIVARICNTTMREINVHT